MPRAVLTPTPLWALRGCWRGSEDSLTTLAGSDMRRELLRGRLGNVVLLSTMSWWAWLASVGHLPCLAGRHHHVSEGKLGSSKDGKLPARQVD